jgi:2-amino-4-hydroxy-6-hydroxymethyldihydropteridine diphosphokinase
MGAERAAIALGSNLGDRAAKLARARDAIARLPTTRIVAASDVEETAPIGPVPQGPYLNQMLLIETGLAPRALLDALLAVEEAEGRVRKERWGPRTLDCDIVLYGARTVREPGLEIPHPELPNRAFWQRELRQLGVNAEGRGLSGERAEY